MSLQFKDKASEERFEYLCRLYKENPSEFERQTRLEIADFIESCSQENKKGLQVLQFKIDSTLRKYKDPKARKNKMVEIFWQKIFTLDSGHKGETTNVSHEKKTTGTVLPFLKCKK